MKIQLAEITVRELTDGYEDSQESGVVGYGGRLDIRPPYQREFVYKDPQRDAVIDTVIRGYPLNVMYWSDRGDGNFEIIDGQQRTVSLCQYIAGDFSLNGLYFYNLKDEEKEQLQNYKLMIYICSGTDRERLEWFKTINIAGEELTAQELRNAVYSGSWVTDAKRYFSKTGCPANGLAGDYLSGSSIRQDYLQTIIKWATGTTIEEYMGQRQHEKSAEHLWIYLQEIVSWLETTFPKKRINLMKGLPWGELYNNHKSETYDAAKLEIEINRLLKDDDVTKKSGVYQYLLTGKEKYLNLRSFDNREKTAAYERQKGICVFCNEHFDFNEMQADHITPWHEGGKTIAENCQMLCADDNRKKSGK